MQYILNTYPTRLRPDPVRTAYSQLKYYAPIKYLAPSRYGKIECVRTQHTVHFNKYMPQVFEHSRSKEYHRTIYHTYMRPDEGDSYYTVPPEYVNRLDLIAAAVYNNASLWWVIAKANYIYDAFQVPAGISLRVPKLSSLYGSGGVLDA